MKSEVVKAVLERSKGLCEVCGSNGNGIVELHHVVRRKVEATPENCIMLCYEHHRGTFGVHGSKGAELDRQLKKTLQGYYKAKGYDEDTVRQMMGGRLYD